MVAVAPRSTRSHCGSLQALPQRVSLRPSTAAAAGAPPFSVDEASVGRPGDSSESAASACGALITRALPSATAAQVMSRRLLLVRITSPGGFGEIDWRALSEVLRLRCRAVNTTAFLSVLMSSDGE